MDGEQEKAFEKWWEDYYDCAFDQNDNKTVIRVIGKEAAKRLFEFGVWCGASPDNSNHSLK